MYLSLLGEDKDGDEVMRIAPGLAYNKQPWTYFFQSSLREEDHLIATM